MASKDWPRSRSGWAATRGCGSGARRWASGGNDIAFISGRDGRGGLEGNLYVKNADGSAQTNLTNNPAADYRPAWSPDGSRIAFHSYSDGTGNYEVYIMNADGSGLTNLTNNPAHDFAPAWAPAP